MECVNSETKGRSVGGGPRWQMSSRIHIPFLTKPQAASPFSFGNEDRSRRSGLEPTLTWTLSSRMMPILAIFLLFFVIFMGWIGRIKKEVGELGILGSRPAQVAPQQAEAQSRYFSVGSTKNEVLQAQGVPSLVQGSTWSYGSSKVVFRKGRVRGWSSTPEHPLKVRIIPAAATVASVKLIHIGSTKDDVLRLHGTPTRLDDGVWEYGPSKFFFRGDLVVGWSNSPANPLIVERHAPKRPQGGTTTKVEPPPASKIAGNRL